MHWHWAVQGKIIVHCKDTTKINNNQINQHHEEKNL